MGSPSAAIGVIVRTIRSDEEYQQTIALRHRAYSSVGKINPIRSVDSMGDAYDARSVILGAIESGKIIGTLRVHFPLTEDPLYHGRNFPKLPLALQGRDTFVEASRMCVDPDRQRMGLSLILSAHMIAVASLMGKAGIIAGAAADLVKHWQKLEFVSTGHRNTI